MYGGPSSFIMPLQMGKKPIVVPRQYKYNEHVNNHQMKFCKEVEDRMGTIIVVEDVKELGTIKSFIIFLKSIRKSNSFMQG